MRAEFWQTPRYLLSHEFFRLSYKWSKMPSNDDSREWLLEGAMGENTSISDLHAFGICMTMSEQLNVLKWKWLWHSCMVCTPGLWGKFKNKMQATKCSSSIEKALPPGIAGPSRLQFLRRWEDNDPWYSGERSACLWKPQEKGGEKWMAESWRADGASHNSWSLLF